MGYESQCGTNKSHENRFAVHAICLFRTAIHIPWTEKKRHSFLKKRVFKMFSLRCYVALLRMWRRRCFHGINAMILCRQISDVIANENARYKRNELELRVVNLCSRQISIWAYHDIMQIYLLPHKMTKKMPFESRKILKCCINPCKSLFLHCLPKSSLLYSITEWYL